MRADAGPSSKPKVKVRKPVVVKAPTGDVASSGGNYGLPKAKPTVQRELKAIRVKQTQVKDVKSASDLARAPAYVKAHPVVKPHNGGALAFIDNALSGKLTSGAVTAAENAAAATVHAGYGLAKATHYIVPGSALAKLIPEKIAKNAARDVVDLPANAIPSVYAIAKGTVEDYTGDPTKPRGDRGFTALAQPYEQAIKHPLKSFTQHPVGTVLLLRGGEGAIGHGLGRTLRSGIAGKTLKTAAAVDREVRTIPGARVTDTKVGSGDVLAKAAKRVARKVTGRQVRVTMNARDIRRRVNEDVQAAKVVSAEHEHRAAQAAKKAIGRRPTAAVTLAAQGITNASHADLERYLSEIRAEHPTLATQAERTSNERLQKQIGAALAHHNDEAVRTAAAAYSEMRQPQEAQVLAHQLVKPAVAEETRLAGAAVRQGASKAAKRTAVAAGKQEREVATRVKAVARRDLAKSESDLQHARANARVSMARAKKSPVLLAAETDRNVAVRELAQLRRAESKAKGRAEVLSRNVGGKAGGYGVELAQRDIRGARENVRAAEARVSAERARISGVAPAEADALRKALANREQATVVRSQTVAAQRAAVAAHRESKAAPFADQNLQPVTTAQVRARMGPNAVEPAFVTHSPITRKSAALPSARASIAVKINRSGEAVKKGTLDAHPATLVEQAMSTSRLVDAAKAREKFIEDFGYRDKPSEPVQAFATRKAAEGHAAAVKDTTGLPWSPVQRQDGSYAVIPHEALRQLSRHEQTINTHPVAKVITSQWRKNVLAFSPRWLTGNILEAALRSVVSGTGPTSYITGRRALGELKRIDPEAYREARARTIGGGNYATAERVSQERVVADDLAGFAKAAYRLRNAPGAKQLADAYGAYTKQVFNNLNGRLESQFQTAMLGRALRDHPLMDGKVIKFSQRAAQDAAQGLRNTDAQVELGRAVDRMYGAYQKFGPGLRAAVAMYTPFIAWTINAVNFLYHVLPADHPVLTSLITSASQATEDYRKKHGMFLDFFGTTKGQLPPWLQGSITGANNSHLRLSRYMPFGLLANDSGTPIGGLPSLLLPQLSEIMSNLQGKDFTNSDLSKNPNGARDLLAAVSAFIEGQVPAAQQAAQIAGVRLPNQRDTMKVRGGVNATLNPFVYTPSKPHKGKSGSSSPWDAPSTTSGWDLPRSSSAGGGWG